MTNFFSIHAKTLLDILHISLSRGYDAGVDPSVLGSLISTWRTRSHVDTAHSRVYRALSDELLRFSGVCPVCLGVAETADEAVGGRQVCSSCSGTGWRPPEESCAPGASRPVLHNAFMDTALHPDYVYQATGEGVRSDVVSAVLAGWARISPSGDPAGPLASVNRGYLNEVDNLARIAALAAVRAAEHG